MTFSLVAHDPRTGMVGAGAMTAMVGVGKLVPWARPEVGVAATQAFINPYLALDALDLVEAGRSAREALDELIAADPGRVGRQVGVVDTRGGSASWTGDRPDDWKGHRTGTTDAGGGWACQGNRLAGPRVLDDAVEAFLAEPDEDLVLRLLRALQAGEDAGGDTKGHLSATVYVMDREAYPLWDLRVDHAEDPMDALWDLHGVVAEKLMWQIDKMPTRDDPVGGFDDELDHGV
jgi:uncharacterized Ntn-hydrolase superfamily protein